MKFVPPGKRAKAFINLGLENFSKDNLEIGRKRKP